MTQASLDEERRHLRARLKEAMQLHMLPHVAVSTASPIDLTVSLLDTLLEVPCRTAHPGPAPLTELPVNWTSSIPVCCLAHLIDNSRLSRSL